MSPYKDDKDRRTYTTPLGELRSVTSYLDELNKPAFVGWAARVTAEYFKDHLDLIKSGEMKPESMDVETLVKEAKAHHKTMKEQAMELGSAVHSAVEGFFKFEPMPDDKQVAELATEALVTVIGSKLDFQIKANEQEIYHKSGYAGTLDMVGKSRPKGSHKHKPAILDLKTGKAIYEEAKFQVSAYAEAWEQMNKEKIDYAIILRIDKETGKAADPLIMKRPEWKKYYRVFAKLVRFAQAKDGLKPRKEKE